MSLILSRYIPIQIMQLRSYENISQTNFTFVKPQELNISFAENYYHGGETFPQVLNYLPYIVLITGLLILMILYLIGLRRYTVAPAEIYFGEKSIFNYIPKVNYVYEGIKSILRKYFVKVRDKFQCFSCTPRELLKRVPFISKFVTVYEEIVYGNKNKSDVKEALNEVDRVCGEG